MRWAHVKATRSRRCGSRRPICRRPASHPFYRQLNQLLREHRGGHETHPVEFVRCASSRCPIESAGDTREESEQAFFPMLERGEGVAVGGNFYLKVRGTPEHAAASIRSIVHDADPALSQLFGVTATDPTTIAGTTLV